MAEKTEKELVGQFILTTFTPGCILAVAHCEAIKAAQVRLYRQAMGASTAGSTRSKKKAQAARKNGRGGGRPPTRDK